jgi:hypothetical protein
MDTLITIMNFGNAGQAQLVKGYLESFNIEAFIQDELMAQIYTPNIVGGIRLQIKETDAKKALELLVEGGFIDHQ